MAIFEDFVFGLMELWLTAYPQQLAEKQLPFSLVLDSTDLNAVKQEVIRRKLNELKYEGVQQWSAALNRMVDLNCPTEEELALLAEIKASRDIIVHNRGIVNATYTRKSGAKARFSVGERLEITPSYHRDSWELIRRVVGDVSQAAIAKSPKG